MGKPWFRVKRYGYGAGLPCSWEGWVVMAGYALVVISVAVFGSSYTEQYPWAYLAAIMLPTIVVVVIAWRKSDGPWRWRSGKD